MIVQGSILPKYSYIPKVDLTQEHTCRSDLESVKIICMEHKSMGNHFVSMQSCRQSHYDNTTPGLACLHNQTNRESTMVQFIIIPYHTIPYHSIPYYTGSVQSTACLHYIHYLNEALLNYSRLEMCQAKCEHVVNINDESNRCSHTHIPIDAWCVCVLCVCVVVCVHFGSLNKNLISIQLNARIRGGLRGRSTKAERKIGAGAVKWGKWGCQA